jgi:hypothetical protein
LQRVVLDFKDCDFLSAEGAAILALVKLERDRRGLATDVVNTDAQGKMYKQMKSWGVARLYGGTQHPWIDIAIPLLHQPELAAEAVVDYVEQHLLRWGKMPKMTEQCAKRTQISVCEHAISPVGGVAIGQLYPNQEQVQICVADAGIGLVRKV